MILSSVGGSSGPPVAFLTPAGDPGLFGPQSVAWRVHSDFVSMLIGGIGSLILQALHPQALAGVWDYSTFRTDLKGRLGRTAHFIAATTYGPQKMALDIIDKVNNIHRHIRGFDESGKPYIATDPHLLKWVHITETYSFLNSYLTYCNPHLSVEEVDQYFQEMRVVGEKLGATDLPKSLKETEQAIISYQSELLFDERARTIIRLLENFPSPLHSKPIVKLMSRAGMANLPSWVHLVIQKNPISTTERKLLKSSVGLIAIPIRSILKNGVVAHSYRRMYG
jgi:uncharacterized protein (DUF2236 family)